MSGSEGGFGAGSMEVCVDGRGAASDASGSTSCFSGDGEGLGGDNGFSGSSTVYD